MSGGTMTIENGGKIMAGKAGFKHTGGTIIIEKGSSINVSHGGKFVNGGTGTITMQHGGKIQVGDDKYVNPDQKTMTTARHFVLQDGNEADQDAHDATHETDQAMERHAIVNDASAQDWGAAAHKMKGSVAQIGAAPLEAACKKALEAQDVSLEEKKHLLQNVKDEYAKVKKFLMNRRVSAQSMLGS